MDGTIDCGAGVDAFGAGPRRPPAGAAAIHPLLWSDPGAVAPDPRLLDYWRILVRWRWAAAAAFLAMMAAGVLVTLLTPPLYIASVTLEINREPSPVAGVGDLRPTEEVYAGAEFYQTQYGLLRSRSLAERVAAKLRLGEDRAFLAGARTGLASVVSSAVLGARQSGPRNSTERLSQAAAIVRRNLLVTPVRGSRLVILEYRAADPAVAARIVNATADAFISASLQRRYDASAYARGFLERHLEEARSKLEHSERALVAYAERYRLIDLPSPAASGAAGEGPQETPLESADLSALDSALDAAKSDRIAAEQRWRAAEAANAVQLPESAQSSAMASLQAARATVAARYSQDLATFKPDYPAMQATRAELAEFDRQIGVEADTIKQSIRLQSEIAARREAALQAEVDRLKGELLDHNRRSIEYNILRRDIDTNRALYDALLQRYKEIGVAAGIGPNNIAVIDAAEPPAAPSQPNAFRNLALAASLGALAAVFGALLMERLHDPVLTAADVENRLGLPLLGSIPMARKRPVAEALRDPRSPVSEAYHAVRAALQFATGGGAPRTLLVTSARSGEGKSVTALALAEAFARLDRKVLLVEADLRQPSMHRSFPDASPAGLSSLLSGAADLDAVVQPTGRANLWLVHAGPGPPSPAELLAGSRLGAFIAEAAARFDHVLIDAPPVMNLADAPTLAALANATLLVADAGAARAGAARLAVSRLRAAGARLVGCLLTKCDARRPEHGPAYGYGVPWAAEPRAA